MHLLIPFNCLYLKSKYFIDSSFINHLINYVFPSFINRFSLDNRVDKIEIITNLSPDQLSLNSNKLLFTQKDIGNIDDVNDFTKKLITVRNDDSDIIVQVNPLFPFININSLSTAYKTLSNNICNSAVGTNYDSDSVDDYNVIERNNLGIFTAYRASLFHESHIRCKSPCQMIGLSAVEMISLRTKKDLSLYSLVINSGFEIL